MDATATGDELARKILEYAQAGNWRAVAALAIMAVVWVLRNKALHPKLEAVRWIGPIVKWFKTDRGGVAMVLVASELGAISTACAAHQAISKQLILSALINGLLSSGIFVSAKRLIAPPDKVDEKLSLPPAPPVPPLVPAPGDK